MAGPSDSVPTVRTLGVRALADTMQDPFLNMLLAPAFLPYFGSCGLINRIKQMKKQICVCVFVFITQAVTTAAVFKCNFFFLQFGNSIPPHRLCSCPGGIRGGGNKKKCGKVSAQLLPVPSCFEPTAATTQKSVVPVIPVWEEASRTLKRGNVLFWHFSVPKGKAPGCFCRSSSRAQALTVTRCHQLCPPHLSVQAPRSSPRVVARGFVKGIYKLDCFTS